MKTNREYGLLAFIFRIFSVVCTGTKKEEGEDNQLGLNFISQVILITCGDYRLAAFVRRYLKRLHVYTEMDILTTAGGSKTISYSVWDSFSMKNILSVFIEYCKILCKRQALWIDFGAYYHHGAKICVIANHSFCGFWKKFLNAEEEKAAHVDSLIKAGKLVKEKYPDIEKIILLYVVLDKKTHKAVTVVEVDYLSGEIKEVNVEEEERLL
jgi:hypothetical protein